MKNIIYSIRRDTSSHQYNHVHVDIYSRANLDHSCECSAIAPDEETAVKALIKSYAKNMESGYGNYADKLSAWIKDGSPVKVDHCAQCPDVSDLAELIKPMKEKAIEAVAA